MSSATVHEEMAFAHLSIYLRDQGAALEQFSKELRAEVRGENIAVTTFVPGNTMTGLAAAGTRRPRARLTPPGSSTASTGPG